MSRNGTITERLDPPFALSLPIEFRRSGRARRLSLRIDAGRNLVVLVAPHALPRRRALDFLIRHEGWLRARLDEIPAHRPFAHGAVVPVLGMPHRVASNPATLRGLPSRADGVITVPGAPEHLPRRLTDFLKTEAKREIGARAQAKSAALGLPVKSVVLRDTRSRWGSCNRAGRLCFSWRLILAPEFVLDYVVAHEVAHLAEMNHGPRFWNLCAALTDADPRTARSWLRRHGAELHRYG